MSGKAAQRHAQVFYEGVIIGTPALVVTTSASQPAPADLVAAAQKYMQLRAELHAAAHDAAQWFGYADNLAVSQFN